MASTTNLPAPEPTDSQEVAFALEEAAAHWAAGKKDDALYALERAGEAAELAGAVERAAALRATHAELSAPPASRTPLAPVGSRPSTPSARPSVVPAARVAAGPPPPSSRAAPRPPATPPADADSTTKVDRAAASTGDGLHVWVRTSARDPSLLLVRLLPDGQAPPPGAHEAYLRAADLGVDLLATKL